MCNDPFNTDLWCPAYSASVLGVLLSKLWPRFLLLLSQLFWCLSVFWPITSPGFYFPDPHLLNHPGFSCAFIQDVQLWDLLVHTQPLHCLLHHPHGAHGRVGLQRHWICMSVWVCEICDVCTRGGDKSLPHLWLSADIAGAISTSLSSTLDSRSSCWYTRFIRIRISPGSILVEFACFPHVWVSFLCMHVKVE